MTVAASMDRQTAQCRVCNGSGRMHLEDRVRSGWAVCSGCRGVGYVVIPARAPIAATTDPRPSHAAARELTASGERDRQKREVLAAVHRWPWSTASELARKYSSSNPETPLDRYQFGKRLPELRDEDRLVVNGEERACEVTRRSVQTWGPAKESGGSEC